MRKRPVKFFSFPWYPLVLGVYPILALYAQNVKQAEAIVVLRPLTISILAAFALLLLSRLLFSDWQRGAFFAAVLILLFFTYGHLYNFVKNAAFFGILWGRHRFLVAIWLGLAGTAGIVASRKRLRLRELTTALNTAALVLLLFPGLTVASHWLAVRELSAAERRPAGPLTVVGEQELPDVYFIVLDSYTRADVLKNTYGFDNSAFLRGLDEMGFYVARCSTSNYMWTLLSISSTLNMEYLQENEAYAAAADKDVLAEDLIKHSLVRKTLESAGYKTVAFATGFPFNEITDADVFLGPPSSVKSSRAFEALLVQTTLLRVLQDFGYIQINQRASAEFRDRTLFALDQFDDLARMGGPKFVYMHIITPHPPFVFGPNGESVDPKEFVSTEGHYTDETYYNGYIDQIRFINGQILRAIQTLLDESPIPPVVILQGDHGPWKQQGENRVSILNAYLLPGHAARLYPTISPVNSFRVVFDEYFGADYALLDDLSYRSPYASVHDFERQPTSCRADR